MFSPTSSHILATLALATLITLPACGNVCDDDKFDDLCVMDPNAGTKSTDGDDSLTGTGGGEPETDGMSETSAPGETTESPTSDGETDPDPTWGPMNPGPSEHCARILYTDLQPENGNHSSRGVAVTTAGCANAHGGLALQIGVGWPYTVGDEDDVIVPIGALPAAGCVSAHGVSADFPQGQHLALSLAPLPDGEWPTYHVTLLQNWNVVQGLLVGSEGSNGVDGKLMSDTNMNWHESDGWSGSCSLLVP